MKRYLTIDGETLKNCLKSAAGDCYTLCGENCNDPCWKSVFNWLMEDVSDPEFYSSATQIFNNGYNAGYEDGWNQGRRHLVKQIEEKAGIIRRERDRR